MKMIVRRLVDIHIVSDLKQIEELCGKNIKTFSCSSYFTLALTEEGEVYQRVHIL